jgi:hypothetical protein
MLPFVGYSPVVRSWHCAWSRTICSPPMDRYVKRTRAGPENVQASAKRPKSDGWGTQGDPASICVWNCNSLPSRIGNAAERQELLAFVGKHKPDVICFSEVRCAARPHSLSAKRDDGSKRYRSEFKNDERAANATSDAGAVKALLREADLEAYEAYFSLADWRVRQTRKKQPSSSRSVAIHKVNAPGCAFPGFLQKAHGW